MIELIDISKKFNAGTVNETVLFENFNFKVDKGDFVSVIGSNGSGKTTLLNLVAGTVLQDEGSVLLETAISPLKRNTSAQKEWVGFSRTRRAALPLI